MNVSLTPNDVLGRLIHTFSCTAYECDSADYENLEKKNLLPNAQVGQDERNVMIYTSYDMFTEGRDFIL
jgi:hypothetical protein